MASGLPALIPKAEVKRFPLGAVVRMEGDRALPERSANVNWDSGRLSSREDTPTPLSSNVACVNVTWRATPDTEPGPPRVSPLRGSRVGPEPVCGTCPHRDSDEQPAGLNLEPRSGPCASPWLLTEQMR